MRTLQIPTVEEINLAADRIRPHVHETPTVRSTRLGRAVGADLFLKCENLQKTGSFKVRGALNRIMTLDASAQARGVITISAGNHAQALAWSAAMVDVPCVVVMPAAASPIKAAASREYGAEVILHGDVTEAFAKAHELAETRGMTFVHPFDDLATVTGHASAGVEILRQVPNVKLIVVPIGGGGFISGIASLVKQARLDVRIVGVEPSGANAMYQSLRAGRAVHLDSVSSVADGLAPPMAGELNFHIVRDLVDDLVLVDDDDIIAAMGQILTQTKLLVEPAGAAGMAALLTGKIAPPTDGAVVAPLTGGNIGLGDLCRLSEG